jgi:thiamine biosynthesis lipoprotein
LWLAALVAGLSAAAVRAEPVEHRELRPLMGTAVELTLLGPARPALATAAAAAYREMQRLSDMMSHYDEGSVVSAIGRAAGRRAVRVPPELIEVLRMARRVSQLSDGAFDITIGSLRGWRFEPGAGRRPSPEEIRRALPLVDYRNVVLDEQRGTVFLRHEGMRLDLGGIAKLYILHAGMEVVRRHGVAHAMINGGGDVEVTGGRGDRPWRIGIRDPRAPDKLLTAVELNDGFVVTSGDYERYFQRDGRRYHHILDPRTGEPTEGPIQVTLVAEALGDINGLSAAIMVLGTERGRQLIEGQPGLEGIVVDRAGAIWVSPGLRDRLDPPLEVPSSDQDR